MKTHRPYERSGVNIKVEIDLPNYAAKTDLKKATGVERSNLAAKSNLTSLKEQADKIDKDKLKTVPADLNKLSSMVNNDVI